MTRAIAVALLLLGACRDYGGGSNVADVKANTKAGHGVIRIADGRSVKMKEGSVFVSQIIYRDCNFEDTITEPGIEVDLIEGADVQMMIGAWCEVHLVLDSNVVIEGKTSGGQDYSLDLLIPVIEIDDGLFPLEEEHRYVIELGYPGWLAGPDITHDDTGLGEVVVDNEHSLHAPLTTALRAGSAVIQDTEGDGVLANAEHEFNVMVTSVGRPDFEPIVELDTGTSDDGESKGCGGKGGNKKAAFGGALLLLLGLRRRSQRS